MCITKCKMGWNASRTICLMLIAAHPLSQLNCGPVSQLTPFADFLFFGYLMKIVRPQLSLVFRGGWMVVCRLKRQIFTAWINLSLDWLVFHSEIVDSNICYYVMFSFWKGILAGRNKLRYMIYCWKMGSASSISSWRSLKFLFNGTFKMEKRYSLKFHFFQGLNYSFVG